MKASEFFKEEKDQLKEIFTDPKTKFYWAYGVDHEDNLTLDCNVWPAGEDKLNECFEDINNGPGWEQILPFE